MGRQGRVEDAAIRTRGRPSQPEEGGSLQQPEETGPRQSLERQCGPVDTSILAQRH